MESEKNIKTFWCFGFWGKLPRYPVPQRDKLCFSQPKNLKLQLQFNEWFQRITYTGELQLQWKTLELSQKKLMEDTGCVWHIDCPSYTLPWGQTVVPLSIALILWVWLRNLLAIIKCSGLAEYELIMQIGVSGKRWPGQSESAWCMWVVVHSFKKHSFGRQLISYRRPISMGTLPTHLLEP